MSVFIRFYQNANKKGKFFGIFMKIYFAYRFGMYYLKYLRDLGCK